MIDCDAWHILAQVDGRLRARCHAGQVRHSPEPRVAREAHWASCSRYGDGCARVSSGLGADSYHLPHLRAVFVHLCSSIAPGAENFVLQLLQSITEEARPSAQLIAAVKQYHSSTNDDPRFLVPILSGFTKDEILAMLPKLVLLPRPKSWIERVLGTAPETSPIIPPAELLTHLHLIDCGTQKERVIKVL